MNEPTVKRTITKADGSAIVSEGKMTSLERELWLIIKRGSSDQTTLDVR